MKAPAAARGRAAASCTTILARKTEHKIMPKPTTPKAEDPFAAAAAEYRTLARERARFTKREDYDNPRVLEINKTLGSITKRLLPLLSAIIKADDIEIVAGCVLQIKNAFDRQQRHYESDGDDYRKFDDEEAVFDVVAAQLDGGGIELHLNTAYDRDNLLYDDDLRKKARF